MVPAWVTKLKDLKDTKSKKKQSNAPFNSPSLTRVSKSPDTDFSMYIAKALRLHRASGKACCADLEENLGHLSSSGDYDTIFSSSDNDAHTCMQLSTHASTGTWSYPSTHICMHAASAHTSIDTSTCLGSSTHISTGTDSAKCTSTNTTYTDAVAGNSELCSYESAKLFNAAEAPLRSIDCKDFEFDFLTMSSCGIKVGPHLYKGKKSMVPCVQNDLHGAIDNDTEGSNVLTPNTIESSFGSESSSVDSSMVGKCTEDNRQRLMLWQEGNDLSGFGSLESGMEASIYPEEALYFSKCQGKSSSEDLQGACSFEVEAMARLSYCEGALNSSKFQESSLGNLKNACSLDTEAMSRLTYNKEHLNWQERSSQNVAEDLSLSRFYDECHTSALASRIAPGCAFSMWYEGGPSLASSSVGPLPMRKEERMSCAPSNVSFMNSNLQQRSDITAKNEGCKVSIVEDLKVIPSVWKERSIFEGTMLCSLSCSEWEETTTLIAAENPGLMLSSKWHESSCTLPNPILESSPRADQKSDLPMCVGQDSGNGTLMCVQQDNSNGLAMCVQQDNSNSLSVCFRQENGNAGSHKTVHDAYLRRRGRHRGSSFSAALPKDLRGVVGDSVALVKMSHNPYEDFRHSMYEMIMEKDLEESMDVEELLYCYLSLNSPEHHELIEEVFSNVWSSILMSVR